MEHLQRAAAAGASARARPRHLSQVTHAHAVCGVCAGRAPCGSAGTLAMRARTHFGSSGMAHALPLYALRPAPAAAAANPVHNPGHAAGPRHTLAPSGCAARATVPAAAALKRLKPLGAPATPMRLCEILAASVDLNIPCAALAAAKRTAAAFALAVTKSACRAAGPAQVLAPVNAPPAGDLRVFRSAPPTPLAALRRQACCCQAKNVGCRACGRLSQRAALGPRAARLQDAAECDAWRSASASPAAPGPPRRAACALRLRRPASNETTPRLVRRQRYALVYAGNNVIRDAGTRRTVTAYFVAPKSQTAQWDTAAALGSSQASGRHIVVRKGWLRGRAAPPQGCCSFCCRGSPPCPGPHQAS